MVSISGPSRSFYCITCVKARTIKNEKIRLTQYVSLIFLTPLWPQTETTHVNSTYLGGKILTSIICKPAKAPQVGFEPTTNRLTADRSTPELLRKLQHCPSITCLRFFCLQSETRPVQNLTYYGTPHRPA
jgi:hypothetical protein